METTVEDASGLENLHQSPSTTLTCIFIIDIKEYWSHQSPSTILVRMFFIQMKKILVAQTHYIYQSIGG